MWSILSRTRFDILFTFSLMCLVGCEKLSDSPTSQYPQRPVKLVVPFGAGGGSDTFARIIQKAVEDNNLLPQPLVIINVAGAGGTVGSRRVKNARPDGYTLLLLHEGILTSHASGRASYGPEAFVPIAGTGSTGMVVCVAADSPYESLKELLEAASETPDELLFSCSLGSPSQFAGLMLENAAQGSQFRYVQSGGGAKRFAGLQGGHADVTALSLAEYMQFKESGLRALGLLSEKRDSAAPDVLTATEQGYDVIASNMQFWWAPKGTAPEKLEYMADIIQQAMQTDHVQSRLANLQIEPVVLNGKELQENLTDRTERIQRVSQRQTIDLPNFPMYALGVVGLLSLFVVYQTYSSQQTTVVTNEETFDKSDQAKRRNLALFICVLTCLYVALMQFEVVGYQLATFGFVLATGLTLIQRNTKSIASVASLAVALSVGLHYVFTQVFVIDLP